MQHTLIAVFDNHADATGAQKELLSMGFSSQEVRLSHPEASTDASSSAAPAVLEEPGIAASIRNFFIDVFGAEGSDQHAKYAAAVENGKHILTVITDGEAEVERAADIVERFGPIDIDEHSEQWAADDVLGAGAMPRMGSPGLQQSAPTSLQFENDRLPLNQQSLNDPIPMGTTYQEPMGGNDELSAQSGSLQSSASYPGSASSSGPLDSTVQRMDSVQRTPLSGSEQRASDPLASSSLDASIGRTDDVAGQLEPARGAAAQMATDEYYRQHYSSTYSSSGNTFDEYAPAYRYGSEMRATEFYRDQPWDAIETDLRSSWERRHAGSQSTWESIKAAVRHGWDRMTK